MIVVYSRIGEIMLSLSMVLVYFWVLVVGVFGLVG